MVRFSSRLKALLQTRVVLAQPVLRRPQTSHLRICRTHSERACKGRVFNKIFFEPTRRLGGKESRGNAPLSASSILSCSSSPFFFERCNFAPGRTQRHPDALHKSVRLFGEIKRYEGGCTCSVDDPLSFLLLFLLGQRLSRDIRRRLVLRPSLIHELRRRRSVRVAQSGRGTLGRSGRKWRGWSRGG